MKKITLILAVSLTVGTGIAALAHGGATGIVKERMDGMSNMGKALGSIAKMFKGQAEFDAEQVAVAADIILEHAGEIEKQFPDTDHSRGGSKTEALPSIWESKDDFLKLALQLQERSTDLKEVAATGDKRKIRISFAGVAKSCAACHTDYRKPE